GIRTQAANVSLALSLTQSSVEQWLARLLAARLARQLNTEGKFIRTISMDTEARMPGQSA
ncbi:MAG: hypothetical protein AAB658_12670, partial [Chloroflexota bacterium]